MAKRGSERLRQNEEASRGLFLSWLNPTPFTLRKEEHHFDDFDALYAELCVERRPLRMQTTDANCVIYALWTAIEVLTEELPAAPPFMDQRIDKKGLHMRDLHDKGSVQHTLASLGIKTVPETAQVKSKTMLLKALERGPIVIGILTNMFDDENHVRHKGVKRELLDAKGRPNGKFVTCMISHSVCVCGYCVVEGKGYFITKDTQDPELFGCQNGCSLLPEEETTAVGELYILCKLGEFSRADGSRDTRHATDAKRTKV